MSFALTSSAFKTGEMIPARFTCDGENIAPPLAWSGAPAGTRGFALILDDPDAPGGRFTHWVLHDIPATASGLEGRPEGVALRNSFGRAEYGGPCPPPGDPAHRYMFRLYAVDSASIDVPGGSRTALERALTGHTLAVVTLMGLYQRQP